MTRTKIDNTGTFRLGVVATEAMWRQDGRIAQQQGVSLATGGDYTDPEARDHWTAGWLESMQEELDEAHCRHVMGERDEGDS